MFNNKISRREFLKIGILAILAVLTLPLFKNIFNKKVSRKEARYYKTLAG